METLPLSRRPLEIIQSLLPVRPPFHFWFVGQRDWYECWDTLDLPGDTRGVVTFIRRTAYPDIVSTPPVCSPPPPFPFFLSLPPPPPSSSLTPLSPSSFPPLPHSSSPSPLSSPQVIYTGKDSITGLAESEFYTAYLFESAELDIGVVERVAIPLATRLYKLYIFVVVNR